MLHLATLACGVSVKRRLRVWGVVGSTLFSVQWAQAQRLSDWLLDHPDQSQAYPLGLSWQVATERVNQAEMQRRLLAYFNPQTNFSESTHVPQKTKQQLWTWLGALPVTGRLPVAVTDPYWLKAHPADDPVLGANDRVVPAQRPHSVTVLTPEGTRCAVAYQPEQSAVDYLRACHPESSADYVYVAQPDGQIQRWGMALWNRDNHPDAVAPGSWLWAPPRSFHIPDELSQVLIAFVATQGPAQDPPATALEPLPAADFSLLSHEGPRYTANDWGQVGVLQTPSARMNPAGTFSLTYSQVQPYDRANVFLQPLDWMEFGFRYSFINNRLYGPVSLSGTQNYVDKSIDVKFKLSSESAYLPETALGFRDVAGTGLFSGEYLVASKRTGSVDWSAGLGWGYVGGRGDFGNPLSLLGSSYAVRNNSAVGSGGNFAFSSYFHGRTSPFGGLQWQTPLRDWIVKAEYDGNNYQNEPLGNVLPVRSPINAALVYRLSENTDLTLGWERGNTALVSLSLHAPLASLNVPKLDDPAPVPVHLYAPTKAPEWQQTTADIEHQTQWVVRRIEATGHTLTVVVEEATQTYLQSYLDRAVAVLQRDAPQSFTEFQVLYQNHGIVVARHIVDRALWVKNRTQPIPPSQQTRAPVVVSAPSSTQTSSGFVGIRSQPRAVLPDPSPSEEPAQEEASSGSVSAVPIMALQSGAQAGDPSLGRNTLYSKDHNWFETRTGFDFNYLLGGPNGFVLYELAPTQVSTVHLSENTWIDNKLSFNAFNNYNHFTYDAPSNLPRVRTYLREYLTTSRFNVSNLQLSHFNQVSENQYTLLYAGYLEEMFGGVGGEWLYRPMDSRLAFGVDMNEVQQRNFAQDFGFRNYRVTTGHARLYWDTGWEKVFANIAVGRYLAGDTGATLSVSKAFDNGVVMGAFMTRTNVSAAQFGEGSFDKGVYVSIPFDAFMTKSSPMSANFLWKPLTRDGGAMLSRQAWLYDLTNQRADRALSFAPAPADPAQTIPEHRQPQLTAPVVVAPPAAVQVVPQKTVTQGLGAGRVDTDGIKRALESEGYHQVEVAFVNQQLTVSVIHHDLHPLSRIVGQATRTILHLVPLDLHALRVSVPDRVHYQFDDVSALSAYLAGRPLSPLAAQSIHVTYDNPSYAEADPLAEFASVNPVPEAFASGSVVSADFHPFPRVWTDVKTVGHELTDMDWGDTILWGGGLVVGSALLDHAGNQFGISHGANPYVVAERTFGNALPWASSAAVSLTALVADDPVLSRTAYASSEAGVTSYFAVLAIKRLVGRARPWTNQGSASFHWLRGSAGAGTDSFPSGHTIVTWAELAPFAMEYDQPALYGLAAMTNLGRISGRHHWVSDTVTSSFLGYGLGKLFWRANKPWSTYAPEVTMTPLGVNLDWKFN
ncbi:MAG: phosphatase PAP2 family protein [Ferrovum sp.]|nr:phosphatase PAP2 family protein [Ferrovum sp.]